MTNLHGICPIWGVDCRSSELHNNPSVWRVENSFRAGGDYEITTEARLGIEDMQDAEKARLTSMLVEQWIKGVAIPRLTVDDVLRATDRRALAVHQKAERLLRLLAGHSSRLGETLKVLSQDTASSIIDSYKGSGVPLDTPHIDPYTFDISLSPSALAWSETVDDEELNFLTDYLAEQGWITKATAPDTYEIPELYCCRVEVPGYSRIEELETNPDSSQCFVAMWFDDSMNEVYRNGIEPAIKAAGFSPFRIDREDFVGKIDDKIIVEIRRSRFIVADFTHGDSGARGGVYYEAGFAEGHGLDVIFTCRNGMIDEVHFDTRQFNHIVWNNPEDLRERLENRIRRVIGEGPNANQ